MLELLFGLLIPDLGQTEIFEPICRGIAGAPEASRHALLWGHSAVADGSPGEQALALCSQFIERGVSGVFFAPVEGGAAPYETNQTVVSRLEEARIPVVLLDRCVMRFPDRCHHDLVGIDNRHATYVATSHLLGLGAARVSFLALANGAPTVQARIAGFRETFTVSTESRRQGAIHLVDAPCTPSWRPLRRAVRCWRARSASPAQDRGVPLRRRTTEQCEVVYLARRAGLDDQPGLVRNPRFTRC